MNFNAKYKNHNLLFDTLNPYELNVQLMLYFIVFRKIYLKTISNLDIFVYF